MKKIIINCDGGSRGNPGPAAIGLIVWDENRNKLETLKKRIGRATNNVAEYKALIAALKTAKKHAPDILEIFMDSELVVKQMRGEYRVRSPHLVQYYEDVKKLESAFKKVVYRAVRRHNPYQTIADTLLNQALDSRIHG